MADSMRSSDGFSIVSKMWPIVKTAECDSGSSNSKSSLIKRADTESLKQIFEKYASQTVAGQTYMTPSDFVQSFLGLMTHDNYNKETLKRIANCADTTKDGLISFVEFQSFEALLCNPDAIYALAFQLFDTNSSGFVTIDEFEDLIKHTEIHQHFPFNFNCDFMTLHFGKKRQREVNYAEFTQILHDFHEEHALQAFCSKDKKDTGFISSLDFYEIMTMLKSHLLTDTVKENLISVTGGGKGTKQVSYQFFTGFISLLNNMELIKRIYFSATKNQRDTELTKEELLTESQKFTQITPMEIDILFLLVDQLHHTGRIKYVDIENFASLKEEKMPYQVQAEYMQQKVKMANEGKGRGFGIQVLENAYRFALGSVAGAVGATAVYPIDLVKTRMQNQRAGSYIGEVMYRNSFDCFKKVLRHEGFRGLYRGLAPQIVGVAPEKAIKLTVNDIMRDKLTSTKDGRLPLWGEIVSGGMAGGCQVVFTNPLEIVKIRLQVAGEVVSTTRISAISVIKDLGLFGLYKGSRACFARDIPFSAIYFTLYAHLKQLTADSTGYNNPSTLLLSATLSGAPAASLTTPFDVIKTRLQVVPRPGQTTYTGMFDCARKIWIEEGGRAFWKGAPARVFRSSPQFGVTLLTYELLQRFLYIDFGGKPPIGSPVVPKPREVLPTNPDHIGGYRLALATFSGMEAKFGLCLPKFTPISTKSS